MNNNREKFMLEALVDFPDDALSASQPITAKHIDSLMARLAELGVGRVSWGYYGDGHSGWLMPTQSEDYAGGWQRCADTYRLLENPLRVAVEAGHKYGLEVYAYYKPYETGAGILFPEGSPQAKDMGLLPHIGGQLVWMEPFVKNNPHLRLKRRKDVTSQSLNATISTIRLIKQDALPTRITKEHLQIWTSSDNWCYKQLEIDFSLSQSIEPALHDVRDEQGEILTHQGEDIRVLKLSGLDIKDKYVLVTTDFTSEGNPDFSNSGTAIMTAHDSNDNEILGVFATGGTVWAANLVNFREGGLTFDYCWGAKRITLDEPNTSGKKGIIAFTRGRNQYLSGALCETEPKVQDFWLSCIEEMIDAGVDGVDFREENHSSHTDSVDDYGFNEIILQQFGDLQGSDLCAKISEVRGDAYTEFLRKCKERLTACGKHMRYNLQLDFFRPDPPTARLPAYPANINFQWKSWVDEGLMDEAILRFYHFPFDVIFQDSISSEMISRCQQRGIPIVVNRYVNDGGSQLPKEVESIYKDQRFSGFILYETANFLEFDDKGGCSLKMPIIKEAVNKIN